MEHRWHERAEAAEAALEQAHADMADIRADMARQYATLQVCHGEGCSSTGLLPTLSLLACMLRLSTCQLLLSVSVQDHSSQQLQGLEERMADAQAQMRAALQLAETAESRAKQLLQEKEHMVSALHLAQPLHNPQIRRHRHTHGCGAGCVRVCVCLQAARHEQEVQQLHRQYAAMMQGELGKMRERLQEQYNEACGEAALTD